MIYPNVPQDAATPRKDLLSQAIQRMGIVFNGSIIKMRDRHGVFAYDMNHHVLVAKRYIYRNIVSAHARAVASAMNQGKELVMYISDANALYSFSPREIMEKAAPNWKGGAKMLNFPVSMGRRLIPRGETVRLTCFT